MKKENGITLISLIITIIIMLILAGVSLSMVMGDGSMLDQANAAADKTKIAEVQEYIDLATASNKMAKYSKIGLKSKDTLVTEMAEQGLITDAEKTAVLGGADLEINGTKIEFSELETSYQAAVDAGVTEEDEVIALSGSWTWNNKIIFDTDYTAETVYSQPINFTSNGESYRGIKLYSPEGIMMALEYTIADAPYGDGHGIMEFYKASHGDGVTQFWEADFKTMNFGTTPQEVSQEFYNWFIANATKN